LNKRLNTNSAVWTQFPKLANSPFNGIVSVSLSNSACKDGNVRFTTVPLKDCLIKYELDIHVFVYLNCYFHCGFAAKITFIVVKINGEIISVETFIVRKTTISFIFLSNQGSKDTIVNPALSSLHGGSHSLGIMRTVPLTFKYNFHCWLTSC